MHEEVRVFQHDASQAALLLGSEEKEDGQIPLYPR